MKYNKEFFDTYLERRGTRSIKWDGCNEKFGVDPQVEMLPMWIADMDFPALQEIVDAVTERAQYGMGFDVKKFSDFGMYNKVWLGFIFMVIVMVIVMQLFEKLKDRLLKWTID